MDRETNEDSDAGRKKSCWSTGPPRSGAQSSRRTFLRVGVGGAGRVAAGGGSDVLRAASRRVAAFGRRVSGRRAPRRILAGVAGPRLGDEARHYLKLGRNVQCKMCPNQCLLEPEDRSHCRKRVNKDGTLYTLAYGNPCALHLDPIEKKPLFHFLPGTAAFSIATAGCVYRCLNCQNWDISQAKPDETKDPDGEPQRLDSAALGTLRGVDPARVSMFPEDVVALAEHLHSDSIAYTYSEPIAWYEYMFDTAQPGQGQADQERLDHLRLDQ